MVTEQERRAEGSTFAEMRLLPSWKQLRREEMGCRRHVEEEAICKSALYSPEDSWRREMRHWIVCRCSVAELQSVQLWVKSKISFLKESTKLGHNLLLCICPWGLNCKFRLLVVEFLGKNVFKHLAIWRHSFNRDGLGLLGWTPSSHEERGKDPVLGREAKRNKQTTIHSNEEKLKEIWIQPAVTQMQQLRKISLGTMGFYHQKLNVRLNVKLNLKN